MKQPGVYPCEIRFNFCCTSEMSWIRDKLSIFDNNAFVTLWVTTILLEVSRFQDAPLPSDRQLTDALAAVNTYHDKNRLEDGVLMFWPQSYNSTAGIWSAGPSNLGKMQDTLISILAYLEKIFNDLGLGKLWKDSLSHLQQML